jgi:hypothetical protein
MDSVHSVSVYLLLLALVELGTSRRSEHGDFSRKVQLICESFCEMLGKESEYSGDENVMSAMFSDAIVSHIPNSCISDPVVGFAAVLDGLLLLLAREFAHEM